jgi:mevalonate kinase
VSNKKFRSNGKLLLFGEYAVLDGAKALAIPCKKGQTLQIKAHRGSDLIWECFDLNNELWFEAQISLYDFSSIRTSDKKISEFLAKLLKATVRHNTEFLNKWNGFKAVHKLEFHQDWGLGSSSTLINNVANWAEINPFHLHFDVSSGSGYDIACAEADGPIVYQLKEDELHFEEIDFDPSFLEHVNFLFLGNKQSSSSAISHYSKAVKQRQLLAAKVSELTERVLTTTSLSDFMQVIEDHENLLAKEIGMQRVQQERFPKFEGVVKSLGAWGGDFAMVVSAKPFEDVNAYFKNLGYSTLIPYYDMLYSTSIKKPVLKKA